MEVRVGRTAPVTEIYVVVTVAGELDDADVRTRLAEMLFFAAESFERPGFRGGVFGQNEGDESIDEIEIMVVDSVEAAARIAAAAEDGGSWGGGPADA